MEIDVEIDAAHHVRDAADAVRNASHSLLTGEVPQQLSPVIREVLTLIDRLPPLVLAVLRCARATSSGTSCDNADAHVGARMNELLAGLSDTHSALVSTACDLGRAHTAAVHLDDPRLRATS